MGFYPLVFNKSLKMDNLAVTQSFKIGGDRAINILSTGDLFGGLGAVIAV